MDVIPFVYSHISSVNKVVSCNLIDRLKYFFVIEFEVFWGCFEINRY